MIYAMRQYGVVYSFTRLRIYGWTVKQTRKERCRREKKKKNLSFPLLAMAPVGVVGVSTPTRKALFSSSSFRSLSLYVFPSSPFSFSFSPRPTGYTSSALLAARTSVSSPPHPFCKPKKKAPCTRANRARREHKRRRRIASRVPLLTSNAQSPWSQLLQVSFRVTSYSFFLS